MPGSGAVGCPGGGPSGGGDWPPGELGWVPDGGLDELF
ncbi:hypothetical protein FTUN_6816 [Frigoriglobus tundricola]|uniref:Uncharacterized protein n=1 Tax=Frigoriglobus tundricola TaxID=2774151 RepID=A0A6M5Z095_9BACT|nr:hypothetical protein FTUN_6816 [Frigoriglobus tundricola]